MQQPSLLDIKISHSPAAFATFLREQGDIFWWERGKFWVITSHEYAKQILTSTDFTCDRTPFFISRMPNLDLGLIQDFFGVVGKMMVMSDAPLHTARRRICYDGFTTQTLANLHPLIEKTIDRQLSQCLQKGHIELVEDLAKMIPSTILADFFHIPEEERSTFYEWSNNMTQFFGGASQYRNEDGIEVNHSARSLRDYFVTLVEKRRAKPESDFLSILIKNQQAFGLTDDEIISQAIMMLVAGQVTTTDQLCNNLYTLMTAPHALETLQAGDVDMETALDELNRLDPAVTFIFRVTKNDTFIGHQPVRAGDVIFISTHAVNRDSRVFDQPDDCVLARPNNKQLSYGFGSHYCIGAKLARLEMQNCFTQLLKRLPGLHLLAQDPPKRKHHSLAFSGFERLPLGFHKP
ncbi:cytochrome P450 [Aquicella lusitana]|uniref:Cytochrome P450 PksS n=1 Tax=Aquicella lusitana TaxID=254246 RepID=A0A370GCT4_9COXI|nr:cytochrome P450 [Aquicella lusitana]RDI41521.1 cytochrome P450 PksS [Aquicella lusitana]VVC72585.1 Biotin biosynthesis cytochrome P450 [Aquicella lusitana]